MLREDRINEIIMEAVKNIRESYNPEKIILYGSYAYGKPTEDSDLDLFIVKETGKRRPERFVDVSRILHKPDLGIYISPMVYTPQEIEERLQLQDPFVSEILAKGKILYAQ